MNNAAEAAEVTCDLAPLRLPDGVALADRLGAAPELNVAAGQVHGRLGARTAGIYAQR